MTEILGRRDELAALERLAGSTAREALLLDGPAGIGKTTLWLEGKRLAAEHGRRVLVCRPAGEDTRLSFAGLSDLLAPVLDEALPALPTPQRRALEVALLLRDPGDAPLDERAVFTAFASTLRLLAAASALTIAIDDAQWLDPPSVSAVAFAYARLDRDAAVALLVARRSTGDEPAPFDLGRPPADTLARLEVGRLSLGALSRLLRERLGSALPRPTMLRIEELSGGNPFFALELGRSVVAAGRPILTPALVPTTLTDLLQARLEELPPDSRETLLLAAAAGRATIDTLGHAAAADPWPRIRPAVAAGVVAVDDNVVSFTHPLLGAAVYASADAGQRRAAHEALAGASADVEERARHLAQALTRPDGRAADVLEEAAERTQERGARSVGAELFEAAARLTPASDRAARVRRLLRAADATYDSGDTGRARSILEGLVAELDDGPERTEARWRLGVVLDETGHSHQAMQLWQEALAAAAEPHLVAEIRRSMAVTSAYTGSVADAVSHADAAVVAAEASGRPRQRAYAAAARAYTAILAGDHGYRTFVERALELEPLLPALAGEWSPSAAAAECARLAHDLPEAKRRFEEVLRRAVESGDANVEQWASFGLADVEVELGELVHADELADAVLELAEQTEVMRIPGLRLRGLVDTLLGRADAARAATQESLAESARLGEKLYQGRAHSVLGFLALSEGDAAAAADHLGEARRLAEEIGFAVPRYLRPYLDEAEAAAAAGRPQQAEEAIAAFEVRLPEPPDWLAPLLLRARAVVHPSREGSLLDDLVGALADGSLDELPFERARTLLVLGVGRRRALERAAARRNLQDAEALFERLGTPLWAARAHEELARIGGRAAEDGLTPAEQRVAELAARGSSNKEIAAALFVTVKTVEATLSRVYRKLGVRSRAALGHTLAQQSVGESPLAADFERP
jgi:DNA-binding CsgD family transcriptional regulator